MHLELGKPCIKRKNKIIRIQHDECTNCKRKSQIVDYQNFVVDTYGKRGRLISDFWKSIFNIGLDLSSCFLFGDKATLELYFIPYS